METASFLVVRLLLLLLFPWYNVFYNLNVVTSKMFTQLVSLVKQSLVQYHQMDPCVSSWIVGGVKHTSKPIQWHMDYPQQWDVVINPLTAGAEYIGVFTPLLPHSVPPYKHVKAIMWHQSARFENSWPPFCQIWIISSHLKLWIASARHNFKWVKIPIE